MKTRCKALMALVGLLAITGTIRAAGSAGDLDDAFHSDGVVTEEINGSLTPVVQSDGRIVAMSDRRIRRYDTDGSVDSTFRESTPSDFVLDTVETDGNSEIHTWYRPQGMIVDGDDNIFLAGYTVTDTTTTESKGKSGKTETTFEQTDPILFVAKLDADGKASTTFGTDGVAILDVADSDREEGIEIALQSDGRIVVAGVAQATTTSTDDGGGNGKGNGKKNSTSTSGAILLARFTSGGSLDTTFGTASGYTVHDRTSGHDGPRSSNMGNVLGIQSNDEIVLGSVTDPGDGVVDEWVITRYGADGSVDESFGSIVRSDHQLFSLAIDANDKIAAVGTDNTGTDLSDQRAVVVRYGANGAIDPGFGTNGLADTGITGRSLGRGLAVDSAGNVVVSVIDAYLVNGAVHADGVAVRFDSGGGLDTTFGTGGESEHVMVKDVILVNFLAMDTSGRIVGGGSYNQGGFSGFLLVRWIGG